MKITLHDGRIVTDPTEADVDALLAALSDAGDFIILSDRSLGEVRAAGPRNGTFLIQCNLTTGGRIFAGERRDVELPVTTAIFREFRAGRVEWSSQFASRGTVSRLAVLVVILTAVAMLVLLWFRRAA